MTNAEKIQTILRSELATWKTMSKDRLLEMMIQDRRFFLETEVDQGNAEYLDELIEEIDVEAVWALQHPEAR
jgi:recombinational DNA repair ATPase RecF